MLYLFLHLIVLIYVSSSWPGIIEYKPVLSLTIWFIATLVILYIWLPQKTKALVSKNYIPDFFKTHNQIQWAITLWILLLQVVANPIKIFYPSYENRFEQFLPMLVSTFLYYWLTKVTMNQFRKTLKPILPPEQTEKEFFRARITNFFLAIPPILLWMLLEDTSRSGLEIVYEIKLIVFAPVFFLGLFLGAPKLFNWTWKATNSNKEELNDSIKELAKKTNTKISGVKIWNFRYVYVTEYLLETLDENQVKAVISHELGHLKLGHVFSYTIYSILVLLLSLSYKVVMFLYFPEVNLDGFTFSLIEGTIFLFFFLFTFTALSRFSEHQADMFSALTVDKESFISVIQQLDDNLEDSVKKIPFWLSIHPPNESRILKVQENIKENIELLLQQARNIRYAMLVFCILILLATIYPLGNVMKISALYEAKKAKNELLLEELTNSLPRWLKNHPEVLQILHHSVSPEVTLDL